jgi:hypothetical protein
MKLMNISITYRTTAVVLPFLLLIVIACKKEPQVIGLDLVGKNPLSVEFSDTTTVIAYSVLEDSVRTDRTTTTLLGSIYDMVFGKTSASVYTQIAMSVSAPDFGANPQCDSMTMVLSYVGYYGDTLTPQTVKIYELVDSLNIDTSYYSNQSLVYDPSLLSDFTFQPKPNDTVWIDEEPYKAQLRIPMNTTLGNKVLTTSTDVLASNSSFKTIFKGLYISADPVNTPGTGAILYMNFSSSYSTIYLYYHNDDSDSLVYRIAINSASLQRFGNYNHYGYADATAEFQNQLLLSDTTLGNQKIYLQCMAGVKTKIFFPYLMNWVKDNKIALNEAQLIFKNNDPENSLSPPSALSLFGINDEGKIEFLPDEYESELYFDGKYQNSSYRFRITRHLQDILNESDPNNGLYLMISGASLNAGRVVLNGPSNPLDSLKLRLVYTKPNY